MANSEKLSQILNDKTIKAKGKVAAISQFLLEGKMSVRELIDVAKTGTDIEKGTIIESIEFASKMNADIVTEKRI